jgi:hypothetical protein
MNVYQNSWPEEQQHLQRHQDLLREADERRLVRLAQGEEVRPERASRFHWAWLARVRCQLSTLFEHAISIAHLAPKAPVPTDCP